MSITLAHHRRPKEVYLFLLNYLLGFKTQVQPTSKFATSMSSCMLHKFNSTKRHEPNTISLGLCMNDEIDPPYYETVGKFMIWLGKEPVTDKAVLVMVDKYEFYNWCNKMSHYKANCDCDMTGRGWEAATVLLQFSISKPKFLNKSVCKWIHYHIPWLNHSDYNYDWYLVDICISVPDKFFAKLGRPFITSHKIYVD